MKNVLSLTICWSVLLQVVMGQSTIGTPAIRNYSNADYHSGMGVWDIGQDKNGILYFAGDEGLMTFDGSYWKVYPLPNKAAIRSLAIGDSGKVYVGGQDEVGYFMPSPGGMLTFHSIKQLLPSVARQFADIWGIDASAGSPVVFRTVETLFLFQHHTIQTLDAPGGWLMVRRAGDHLYADDKARGLLVWDGVRWVSLVSGQTRFRVTGLMEYGRDTLLLGTQRDGLYLLCEGKLVKKPTSIDDRLRNDLVNCIQPIGPDRFALGTHAGGLYIIDRLGRLIRHYGSADGLQNDNVLRVFPDRDGNLWLALENGAAFINYTSAVQRIRPAGQNRVLSNAVRVFGGRLFVGTSNGLYSASVREGVPGAGGATDLSTLPGPLEKVPGTEGQILGLAEIDHQLFLGHEDGAMLVRPNGVQPIPFPTTQGAWAFAKTSRTGDIIVGTYTGLRLLTGLKDGGRASDLYESLGDLVPGDGNSIWATHPYRGVFKTVVGSGTSTRYTTKDGLPTDLYNFIYALRGHIVAATPQGVYAYDSASNRFSPDPFFKPFLGTNPVEYLAEDSSRNIWFVSDRRVGVIDHRRSSVLYFPELDKQTVRGNAFIYPYDPENIFIGSYDGIIHLNYARYVATDTSAHVLLSAVRTLGVTDSLVFGGYATEGTARFPHRLNSFRFEYASPSYAQAEFSYRLEGLDPDWSAWSIRTEKDYTHLPYGTYTFGVRARNNLGAVSAPVRYTFTVEPAWYQTVWAWLFYCLLLALAIWGIIRWQQHRFALHQKRHEAEQERLSYLHSLEMDRKEKGLIALQNEKLEAELQFKNKELATVTMHLVERGGILANIREELISVIKKLNLSHQTFEFKGVFRMLTDTEKGDDDWNRFALYFDQVHNNFLGTLKAKYPTLSATDLKLCAYLRLNLSSKEIAQLLNISLKGVEISRYRIRKKFQLTPEINLYDFLIEVTSEPLK